MPGVGSADLHEGIITAWDSTNLEWEHKKLWAEADRDQYPALQPEGGVQPGTPMPYTVYSQDTPQNIARQSSLDETFKWYAIDTGWTFRTYAEQVPGDPRDAKTIASDIADDIMKAFGGHPTVAPDAAKSIELTHGDIVIWRYEHDYGFGEEDGGTYQWIVSYIIKLDVPVRVED